LGLSIPVVNLEKYSISSALPPKESKPPKPQVELRAASLEARIRTILELWIIRLEENLCSEASLAN